MHFTYVFSTTLSYIPTHRINGRYQHWQMFGTGSHEMNLRKGPIEQLCINDLTTWRRITALLPELYVCLGQIDCHCFAYRSPLSDQQHSSVMAMIVALKRLLNNTSGMETQHETHAMFWTLKPQKSRSF
jgi:hypothetical protein